MTVTTIVTRVEETTTLSALDITRIGNKVDNLVALMAPRDAHGVPIISREQRAAIQDFYDWLDENFGPIE